MARRSLKALQERIHTEANSGGSTGNNGGFYYPHWKLPKDGITKMRIVEDPNEDNPLIAYVDYLEHKLKIDEDWVRIPCIKNLGKDHNCPICTHSQKLYKAGDDDAGKYYYREMFALLRGIITKDGLEYSEDEEPQTGKLRPFKFSYQLANALKAEIGKLDEDDEFWDLSEGIDFIIEKQMVKGRNGEYGKYDVGSGFARKPTDVSKYSDVMTDEPLSALIPEIPSYDEAATILESHFRSLRGESSTGDDDDDTPTGKASEDELMEKINRRKSSKKEEAPVEDDDDDDVDPVVDVADDDDDDANPLAGLDLDDDDDDDDDDILAKFKS